MAWVKRTFECAFEHRWSAVVERGSSPPDECPICQAIVSAIHPAHLPDPNGRSDAVGAPLPRSERAKAVARWEHRTMVRPHFDDGKPLMTNFKDNVRPGEIGAISETPSTNEAMRLTKEMIDRTHAMQGETPNGRYMRAMGGGWGPADAAQLTASAAQQPPFGLPVVDLKGKQLPK